jgi:DNA-binding NarL/FixJ family response regulator
MQGTIAGVSVVLADDHTLLRSALAQLLMSTSSVVVSADVGTTDEAISACIRHQPSVVVLDVDIPGVDAFEAARIIRSRSPRTNVLFLSAFTQDRYIESALAAGALGYITKGEPPDRAIEAILSVAAGKAFFSPEIQSRIVIYADGARLNVEPTTRARTLTQRELEVLRYIARGMAKKDIARVMHLSVKTVENHTANIMRRLDIHDRVELARFAIRERLVEA